MRVSTVGLLALALVVSLATPVMAAQGTIRGHADYPFEVVGSQVTTSDDAQFLVAGAGGVVTFKLQSVDGTATRILERSYSIVDNRDPSAKVLWQQRVDRIDVPLENAVLSLAANGRMDGFQLLAYDGPATMTAPIGAASGAVAKARLVESAAPEPDAIHLMSAAAPFMHTIPRGLAVTHTTNGHLAMEGPLKLFVIGADLDTTTDPKGIPAFERDEQQPGQLYDPTSQTWSGPGTHQEHIKEYLLVEATSAKLTVQFAGRPALLFAKAPSLAIDGQAILHHVEGTVTVMDKGEETTHILRGEDLTLVGRFTLQPHASDADGSGTAVSGEGDFTTVSYGTVAAHYDWAQAIAAVGLGAAAVAAIAWIVANGKTILGLGGGGLIAGYARVQGNEILEHAGRAEVYERVKAFAGVNFVQLSGQVEFGTSTLSYHLRVLEKNGFVISVRDGRYLRFFDRKSGHYSSGKKLAVSALRNEKTAAIAQHIRANPGVAQCDLAQAFGVTASTVTWHINRLASAGLVQKTRDAHRTRYFLGEGWASLPADEQARQAAAEVPTAPLVA